MQLQLTKGKLFTLPVTATKKQKKKDIMLTFYINLSNMAKSSVNGKIRG